jgi:ketosteroid isomerase-like protein
MIKRLVFLFLVVGAVLATDALAQDGANPVETVRAFHEALASGDSIMALGLLTEDVVIYESGGVEASREEYRSHHLPADMEFASSTVRESTLDRSGRSGDFAWVFSRSRTTGTFRDNEIDSMGTETMFLVRTSDGWRIRHIHWSSRRAP